jgi:hypothetical protein
MLKDILFEAAGAALAIGFVLAVVYGHLHGIADPIFAS